MRHFVLIVSTLATACGGAQVGTPATPVEQDTVLADQAASGGERLTHGQQYFRAQPRKEERVLTALHSSPPAPTEADPGLVQCTGISEDALAGPVVESGAIAQVLPERRDGKVRGTRIVLRNRAGVDADELSKRITCQQARFATLGSPADYLPDDPTLVAGAQVRVAERGGHVEIVVTTENPAAGRQAHRRAQQLARQQTALR